ncbi:Ankyrin repeat and zinc finger domain-containing protein 1 [Euphorbia peplus]|nr:Ankyrin repeat and zinc finger domain-containing protein 1 [Euphorbia peplus]
MDATSEKRHHSIFEVPADFFDACRLLSSSSASVSENSIVETLEETNGDEDKSSKNSSGMDRWTCNICNAEFESLLDQRSHFKSDFHRINVKLSIAGKDIVNEEDLDDLTSDTFKDYDISSISGSEDEADKTTFSRRDMRKGSVGSDKQKLLVRLQTGEKVSLWRCMVLNDFESISYQNDKEVPVFHGENEQCLKESEVVERLKSLIHEPRDKTRLRVILLAGGGHFAGCVFDGNSAVAHKTFHRYVVRAKAGKMQSSKDAGGRAAHSAGASLRRYNELALKKDIRELLAAWKPYFDASTSIFIHAPSSNRQLLFDGDKAYFSHQHASMCNVPMNVRRPTFKEARRIYNQMTQVASEVDEKVIQPASKEISVPSASTIGDDNIDSRKEDLKDDANCRGATEAYSGHMKPDELFVSSESEVIGVTTPLHEAAQSGNDHKVLELLELGMDPCVIDERGRTPYMVANEKEVRNTFRRFMALNLDRWDWHAAKVPSALTKEMEESQAVKQAEKDAKKKARAKELKKLRKAKEKAQAEAILSQNIKAATESRAMASSSGKGQSQQSGKLQLSKEEEMKRAQAAEREKRAAAAEKRMAALSLNAQGSGSSGLSNDIICSCCNVSLAGKVPFHRYNYKYCSTSCMHVHREMLEDDG